MAGTVVGSLPILFFGDLPKATVATIGINPSRGAFLSSTGSELTGAKRRFETLASLGVQTREAILSSHADQAIRAMREYFAPNKPIHPWFKPLTNMLGGFGATYESASVVHLDLIQEATDPTWSALDAMNPHAARALLTRDLPFLKWQIEAFSLQTLICTSKMVTQNVLAMLDAQIVREGVIANLRWLVAVGRAGGRDIDIAGWNRPLARATGLKKKDVIVLGAFLRNELGAAPS